MARPLKGRPDVRFFAEIGVIDQLSRQRIERALPGGLSAASFAVLNHFAGRGGVEGPAELAAALSVTKGAITNSLQRLEALGYLAIADDPDDGRRKRVSLTAAGGDAHLACVTALRPDMESLRDAFDSAEFAAALPFLQRLRDWLEANG